eukprot:g7439.t1
MPRERTYIMIKPDGVQRGLTGKIIVRFEQKGFKLVCMKTARPSQKHLETHYADLKGKKFFPSLIQYMLSGPVVCMVWEGDNVVKTGRKMLGATNPQDSAPGTIRGDFCVDVGRNVCHGSDSVEAAKKEIDLWFGGDIPDWKPHDEPWVYEKCESDVSSSQIKKDMTTICLFDVDGTLTPARKKVSSEVLAALKRLRKHCVVGFVGGSDLAKQKEQLGENVLEMFDYGFSENGLCAFKDGVSIGSQTLAGHLGEDNLKTLINDLLAYHSTIKEIPVKRGTFLEFRTGMINCSPIGRNCSRQERNDFEAFDDKHKIRQKMVDHFTSKYGEKFGLKFSIGGQISFDIFPKGWDKTYCLQFLEPEGFKTIHFFGDKTYKGGNDYEIYESNKTIGHTVKSPADTLAFLEKEFFSKE